MFKRKKWQDTIGSVSAFLVFNHFLTQCLQMLFFQTITILSSFPTLLFVTANLWLRQISLESPTTQTRVSSLLQYIKSLCIKSWTGFLKKSPVVARIASDGDTNRIYRDEFTFSHSRNPTGQPRRRRECGTKGERWWIGCNSHPLGAPPEGSWRVPTYAPSPIRHLHTHVTFARTRFRGCAAT